ncbi:diacylglycerol kinase family protein [Sphaerisporangium sp. TRM90804]|uniref:diacylglycerol/lipid kinase family protein n=1 Tax=Sphaerisporangium sp. TRM90804 TaxID=3031113 RepID=UPI002447038C|nr:diacylglycerol kinase family protein [Sphaerisporangium sp. TRM90804]MDH2427776.1 diacylglycerol kinase family protein [Sphaerisporangium sp. TRM90804]
MRALLLTNPKATSTNRRTRDVLVRALGASVELSVEETGYRGHARELVGAAIEKGFDVVAILGGDGTINEAVNGMLAFDGPRPALMVIPGGSANVFARSLGLPNDPVEATGAVLEAIRAGRRRTISLGQAIWDEGGAAGPPGSSRYFTFCAGLGYDAEVIRAVEGLRSAGYKASPTRYVYTALRHYFMTDRRHPAMRLERPGRAPVEGVFMAIVSNATPWSYIGARAVTPTPRAAFDRGLDLLGLRRLGPAAMANVVWQITREGDRAPRAGHLLHLHDEDEFTLAAHRPVAFQLDGDYLGECERVTFRSVPAALQVLV